MASDFALTGTCPPDTARIHEGAEKTAPLNMKGDVLPVINYAMQQNGAVALRSVTIENTTGAPVENAELRITAEPEFALPFCRHIDHLPAGKTVTLSRPELILNGAYLAAMTEKVTGVLQFRLEKDGQALAADHVQTTVLAYDEWQGAGVYPELLAAFVTPNHPEVAKLVVRASEFMGQWTKDTSMDGYQSQNPDRVLKQAAALYAALQEQSVAYVGAPASFEEEGQRVRLCDMVMGQKLGNCLDLTLLYAACLEAVGLHPLLIASEGHIFAGLWLEEQTFPECVQDDVSLITKRLAAGVNEMAVVETTAVTSGRDLSFDDARKLGEGNLTARRVEYIIDVRRARMSHISPLPQRVHTAGGWAVVSPEENRKGDKSAPESLEQTIHVDAAPEEQALPKKVQWERKLLDLGLRNTLINLRLTKTQLPLLVGSLDELENALSGGSDFSILPKPAEVRMEGFSFDALHELRSLEILKGEFGNQRLRSVLTEGELTKSIKELYRTAKTALEENGANTLYLALGMLRWYETRRSTKPRYAPIILLPIEMVRRGASQGYVIRLRDEEPQMNVTLLEKLKQDFGILVHGVDPLPTDEHGVDIRRVLTIMRKAVMEQPHWDVLETASIGIFSFSQFVMWNDIRNRSDDLMRNKVVRSLMEGRLCWEAQPLEMGDRVSETGVLLPMSADASQLYAIQAACGGESFVLHGPPGTGKSQTITSLIANALAQGRRVLFVAEKMAALEVVQKRLDSIGIGPFCLELHSNKSKKKDVLEQLRKASEVTRSRSAEEYAARAEQIAALREELDVYAQQLHQRRPWGSDLYTLIHDYEFYKDAPDIAPFDRAFLKGLSGADIQRQQLAVERLIAAAKQISHPAGHPLKRVGCTHYTQSLRGSLRTAVEGYGAQLHILRDHVRTLCPILGEKEPASFQDIRRLSRLAEDLACWYEMPPAWVQADFPQRYFEEVEQLARHAMETARLEGALLADFEPGFLKEDGHRLRERLREVSGKWFLPKMLGMNKLAKTLGAYRKSPVDKDAMEGYIDTLCRYQQENRAATELLQKYGEDLGGFYLGRETDWETIRRLAVQARDSARRLYEAYGSYLILRTSGGRPELKEAVFGLVEGLDIFVQAKSDLDSLLDIVPRDGENWLAGELTLCRSLLEHEGELKEWIAYVGAAAEAKALGLGNVAAGFEREGDFDALAAYKKALFYGLICDAIDDSGALNQFSGAVFREKIQQYKRMDQELTRLSQEEIYCRLAGKVPNFTREAAHSSELGILQRCIKSGGRGMSIRRLFDQIPNLLPRLCPCMLMSPISAAQYLDPKGEPFDIVVFDEASQLPTCKAVGVLARGKDAVIVGDPKQMPPTSFFATNTVDEDNLETEDLESILDDCLALNMPQSHLLWHYRSRHESLIAFSNSQFYENKLFTFPSVNDRASKVRLIAVEGVFDRGKTRTNRAEAEAVVAEICRRFADPELSGQSVGVVTFNISQQHLIDDLLSEACARDPELEKWVYGGEEPLFIKNLENVQGDERDVILFSIGFGPDETGKVYMNFGPLNREGGWRRLNVAVSRARCEMMVFSTLRPEQLDLNRTKAEGVAALRGFLEYAAGKPMALEETELPAQRRHDGVAMAICKALEEKGYETDLSVGRSEYRIDIGVIDPEKPDTYLLGILLDGDGYGGAKTTRDREVAQVGVLKGLGWNLLRVWSMDWWDSRQKELSRIFRTLEDLQKAPKEPKQPKQPQQAPSAPETPPQKLQSAAPVPAPVRSAPLYRAAVVTPRTLSAEDFIEPRYSRDIQKRITMVIEAEAPVSLSVLTKRVVQSCGIARAGSRIQNHMAVLLRKMRLKTTVEEDTVFYWKQGQTPETFAGFRVCGEGDNRRDVRDVPVQEVANAIYTVLYEQVSMEKEDLLRETARKLGYTRLGGNVLSRLDQGIRYAEGQGGIALGTSGTYVLSAGGTARAEDTQKSF